MTNLPRAANRSWWLEEALALPEFAGEQRPPLSGDTTADVVILGGGYTGLWSAYFLKERDPSIDIVLLEQDICGGGPSGRNGGFLNAFWYELAQLARLYGDDGALTLARIAARSIREIGEWCERHDVDAWYAYTGDLGVSTGAAFDGAWRENARTASRLGLGDLYVELSPHEVAERCGSPLFRGGVFQPDSAGVQPARLARGLRRVLLERGVRIYEHTPVRRFCQGSPVVAETPGGTVRAGGAILGVNAWGLHWKAFRRLIMVRGTFMVMTAPAPEKLEEIGWSGGEGLYDFRTGLHYVRRTPDGRIAFGGAGMGTATRHEIGPKFRYEEAPVRRLIEDLHGWFPSFRDVPIEAAWGGPIDVSSRHLPFFGAMRGGNVHYALGFTGNGVGPCHLAGRILSGLSLDIEDEYTTLPIVDDEPKRFPPEPLLSTGAAVVTAAMLYKDDVDERGGRAGVLIDRLAHLPRTLGYEIGP
jgi:glycine/D-amino acid oxidase-like deaminating enzyme